MRVIEPRKIPKVPEPNKKRTRGRLKKTISLSMLAVFIITAGLFIYFSYSNKAETITTAQNNTLNQAVPEVLEPEKSGPIEFSGNEFRLLFDNMLLANTEKVELPPFITGDTIADARIRQIAETRGYKLRRSPSVQLIDVDGNQLQQSVKQPWLALKAGAKSEGKTMTIVSGYRSVKDQRELFLSKLAESGVKTLDIVSGTADNAINNILITVSIPGYSKHHTGYVFDLFCAGWAFENFKDSDCHTWLSDNNYENAKKFGFIPSYPIDADLQGPNPEAWEYVYVGTNILSH
jgi:LAS superfamily LD-carboxypeptidase LdcB